MQATIGDRLHVHSNASDQDRSARSSRCAANGAPPYLVRYPDGHESLSSRVRTASSSTAERVRGSAARRAAYPGRGALAAAGELAGGDPLAAAAALRARARARAGRGRAHPGRAAPPGRGKFGPDAGRHVLHPRRAGAGHPVRGGRGAAPRGCAPPGCARLADLGCGLGADALAAARAGIRVYAVEADPVTAALAAANADALGLADRVDGRSRRRRRPSTCPASTRCSATRPGAAPAPGGGSSTRRRTRRPGTSSPGWPRGCRARCSSSRPGIDHALMPAGRRGGVGQRRRRRGRGGASGAARWRRCPARATAAARRGDAAELTGSGAAAAPVGAVRRLPVRPGRRGGPRPPGRRVRRHGRTARSPTRPSPTCTPTPRSRPPFARCFEVTDVLPFSLKRLRAPLRDRGVGRLEILKRGSALDVERLRRDLRLAGDAAPAWC